jgi:hypothetical protein
MAQVTTNLFTVTQITNTGKRYMVGGFRTQAQAEAYKARIAKTYDLSSFKVSETLVPCKVLNEFATL